MIVCEAAPLLDSFVEKVNKDLVDFHKSQKTGFCVFEPYFEDYWFNLNDFRYELKDKYPFDGTSSIAGISNIWCNSIYLSAKEENCIKYMFEMKVGDGNNKGDDQYLQFYYQYQYFFYADAIIARESQQDERDFDIIYSQRNTSIFHP
jgi:hypothetical protein